MPESERNMLEPNAHLILDDAQSRCTHDVDEDALRFDMDQ